MKDYDEFVRKNKQVWGGIVTHQRNCYERVISETERLLSEKEKYDVLLEDESYFNDRGLTFKSQIELYDILEKLILKNETDYSINTLESLSRGLLFSFSDLFEYNTIVKDLSDLNKT